MKTQPNQRRDFLKIVLMAVGAVTVLPAIGFAEGPRRGGGADELPLAEPGNGMPGQMKYHHKTSDVKDARLKKERQGVPFEKQNCANCMLYTKHGMKGSDEVGKCSIFANQTVRASGWCNTWAKKA